MVPNRLLSHARMLRGWSQYVVASKLGTSRKNVSRWECGGTFPSPYYRERLCQVFELDAKSLGLVPPSENEYDVHIEEPIDTMEQIHSLSVTSNTQGLVRREALLQDMLSQLRPGSFLSLTGLPGVGKTALVGKLLQYPQIQERFPDAVIWVQFGPTPNIPRRLAWIAGLLGLPTALLEEYTETDNLPLLLQFLREAFTMRRLLVILDDVWDVEATLPFLFDSPSVAYILTTRLPKVAFALASQQPYVVPPLSFEASLQLLATLAPRIEAIDQPLQEKIIKLTGGVPLAITLIGKYLALHSYGGQVRRLETALNQLMNPEYRLNLSFTFTNNTQNKSEAHSLHTAIALSDQHLPVVAQAALRKLSLLPKAPEYFSEEAALAITAVEQDVLDMLVDGGLLEPIDNRCYQLHQTIADYARLHLKEKEREAQLLLVEYMKKMCFDHSTNITLLEQEYCTFLVAIDAARELQMNQELIKGVLVLVPLMQKYRHFDHADQYLRKALHVAISQQNQSLCQEILSHLAAFAQLRLDGVQSTVYQSLFQELEGKHISHSSNRYILNKVQQVVRAQIDTPRLNII